MRSARYLNRARAAHIKLTTWGQNKNTLQQFQLMCTLLWQIKPTLAKEMSTKTNYFFKKKRKEITRRRKPIEEKSIDKTFISKKQNQLHCSSRLKMVSHEIVVAIMIQCSCMNWIAYPYIYSIACHGIFPSKILYSDWKSDGIIDLWLDIKYLALYILHAVEFYELKLRSSLNPIYVNLLLV